MHQERQLNRANFCETQRDLQIDLEFPFEMANKPDDSVRVYTTDTVVDNPGAKVAYKGLIFVNCEGFGPIVELRAELIEKAKKKAEELDANAIVGMKIQETIMSNNWMVISFYGTAGYVLRLKGE